MIYEINDCLVDFDKLHKIFINRIGSIDKDNNFIKTKYRDHHGHDLGHHLFQEGINPYDYEARNFVLDPDDQILGFVFNFTPRDLVGISKIMNAKYSKITGLRVLRNWIPHLDISRKGQTTNIVLSGKKSSTVFYDFHLQETVRIVGKNFYHFDPSKIIHSAEIIGNEHMDILSLENDMFDAEEFNSTVKFR
jgi:hypothetical protein